MKHALLFNQGHNLQSHTGIGLDCVNCRHCLKCNICDNSVKGLVLYDSAFNVYGHGKHLIDYLNEMRAE